MFRLRIMFPLNNKIDLRLPSALLSAESSQKRNNKNPMRGFTIRLARLLTSNVVALSSSNHKHSNREKLEEQGLVSLATCQHFSFTEVKFQLTASLTSSVGAAMATTAWRTRAAIMESFILMGWLLVDRERNQLLKC